VPKIKIPIPMPIEAALKGSMSSSMTVFKPDRYLNVKGLNVSFDGPTEIKNTNPQMGKTLRNSHVYAEPIVLKKGKTAQVPSDLCFMVTSTT
ncbi:hypothetical protein HK096_008563, partial [Nowakowskiella sp. JEL0078]